MTPAERHPACDGSGCAGCQWTGAAPHNPAALTECPVCRRGWRACVCVCLGDGHDPMDIAAGYASGGERHIGDLPAWTVTAPLGSASFGLPDYGTAFVGGRRRAGR